jgi:hypothetical protein
MDNNNIHELNNVTNDLLLNYDKSFNSLYNKVVHLNSSIMNKEEIIVKENDEITNKNNIISILNYTNIFLILGGILLLLYGLEKINSKKLLIYSIILFHIYIIVVLFKVYVHVTTKNVIKNIKGVKVEMQDFISTELGNKIDKKLDKNR